MPSRLLLPILALSVFFVGSTEFMLSVMLAPLAVAFHTTPTDASWLISSYALSYSIAAPIIGFLSDRLDRRRLLLASVAIFALDSLALTIAPCFGAAVALRILGGLASATLIPTAFALVSDVMPGERQSAAMGAVMIGMTLGIVAGPVFAGTLTDVISWRAPFHVTATGCLVTFAIGWYSIPSQSVRPTTKEQKRLAWLKRSAVVRPLLAKGLWNGTGVAGFLLAGEVLRLRHGLDAGAVGITVSSFGLGLAAGNLGVGPLRRLCGRDELTLMTSVLLLFAAVFAFLLAPMPLALELVCLAAWGAALGMAAPSSTSILAERAGADKGQVLSISESLNNLTILVVLPSAAHQLEKFGSHGVLIVLLFTLVAGVALTANDLRKSQS